MLAVGAWFWTNRSASSLPEVDLAGLDSAVARTIQQYQREVQTHQRSALAWGNLGSVLQAYHRPKQARLCFSEAERHDPHDPRWPYFQSLSLAIEAPGESLAKLRQTVKLCGSEPEAPRLRLAGLLAETGKWTEAGNEIEELLRAKPDFSPARLLSARHAQALGKIDEAIALAQRCTEDPRTAHSANILLASLYRRQGNASAGTEANRRAATLPPDEPVADPFQAEAALLRDDPRILAERAHPLLGSGRLKEAAPLVERLIKDHAGNSETWLVAGRFQLLQKDFSSATQSLQRHLELDAQSNQGWFQMGLAELGQDKFVEAARSFRKATELKPDSGPAFYNLGIALGRGGKFTEAGPAFREAIRHNPERIDSYLMLADIHLRLGETNAAVHSLQQAEPLNPAHPGLLQLRRRVGFQK
jgi:tetratricopeptide (TPR) repeat protein